MSNIAEYTLRMNDNATPTLGRVVRQTHEIKIEADKASKSYSNLGDIIKGTAIGGLISSGIQAAIGAIGDFISASQEAYNVQAQAETKLMTVMRQRMGANEEEVNSIKKLASAQQELGIIGDEVQLSGAQQLATFASETKTIETLLPAMNNLLAQQKGYNATAEDAVGIGNLMGKVLQGQTSALSRVGISFTEAEEQILKFGTEEQKAATLAQVITNNVGEMNKALAATPEGQLKQMSNDMGDFQEQLGHAVVGIKNATIPLQRMGISLLQGSLPYIEKFVGVFSNAIDRIAGFLDSNSGMFSKFFEPVFSLMQALYEGFDGLMDYITPIWEVFADHILPIIQRINEFIVAIVSRLIKWISSSQLLKDIFSGIMWVAGKIFDFIGSAINALIDGIMWLWDNILEPIIKAIEVAYRWVKDIVTDENGNKTTKKAAAQSGPGAKTTEPEPTQTLPTPTNDVAVEQSAAKAETAIKGGASKVVNINLGKFFDNIEFHTANLEESVEQVEQTVLECLARVLTNGANI